MAHNNQDHMGQSSYYSLLVWSYRSVLAIMPYRDADKVVSSVRKWKQSNPDKVREQKWRARARKQPHIATLYHLDKSSPIVQQLIQEYVAASRVRWETNQMHQITATRARRKPRPKQNPGLKLLEPLGRLTPSKSKSPMYNDSVENEVEPYMYGGLEIRREGQRRAKSGWRCEWTSNRSWKKWLCK